MKYRKYVPKKHKPIDRRYAAYEQEKSAWLACHPEATPEEYQKAMMDIAKRLGA